MAYAREVGPPKPPKAEQSQEVVAEAEGLTLHLSESNGTGYKGIGTKDGRYVAQRRVDGRLMHLGSFGTAVEAAVCFARHVRGGADTPAAAEAEEEGEEEEEEEDEEEEEEAAEVAVRRGRRLHLSKSNSTGHRRAHQGRAVRRTEASQRQAVPPGIVRHGGRGGGGVRAAVRDTGGRVRGTRRMTPGDEEEEEEGEEEEEEGRRRRRRRRRSRPCCSGDRRHPTDGESDGDGGAPSPPAPVARR